MVVKNRMDKAALKRKSKLLCQDLFVLNASIDDSASLHLRVDLNIVRTAKPHFKILQIQFLARSILIAASYSIISEGQRLL